MKYLSLFALLLAFTACQSSATDTPPPETFNRPVFIDFEYIESQVNRPGRRLEAYQADISAQRVGEQETVVLAKSLEGGNSTAYVLSQETGEGSNFEMERGWVVFLQDHLLLISEDGRERVRVSVKDRPFESPAIGESAEFTDVRSGYGLARYGEQGVTSPDLEGVSSYLEARSRIE
ncbi:hypothetical protein CEQ90_10540 [Lewinellaceae bacterium SD302]|nr:hypothetical protein CEQ90_10540 [Lewinellaceae bacterium SD302]